jgi:hypothetical protein
VNGFTIAGNAFVRRAGPSTGARMLGALLAAVVLCSAGAFALRQAGANFGARPPTPGSVGPSRGSDRPPSVTPPAAKHHVTFRPGANLPDRPVTEFTMGYLGRVADIYGGDLIVSYGTAGDHGQRSFHYSGHAADIGMATNHSHNDSKVGDAIMRACLIAAGVAPTEAERLAVAGGLVVRRPPGMVVECIWKVADHHDHVHIAAAPR